MKKRSLHTHYGTHSGSLDGQGFNGHVIDASEPAGAIVAAYAAPFPITTLPLVATKTAPPTAKSIVANRIVTTTFPIVFTSRIPNAGIQMIRRLEEVKRHEHLVPPKARRCPLA